MNESISDSIEIIKKTQNLVAMTIGISMGGLMLIYFFTFSMFADSGYSMILWFQGISSLIFMIIYVFINKISFKFALLRHRGKFSSQPWFSKLTNAHINQSYEIIAKSLEGNN